MLIIDRIEGQFAVCETDGGETTDLLLIELPPGVREGDVLILGREGYEIDAAETLKRRRRNTSLFESLLED
ncbi:MAG: DUF3006 domain-containing protein [Candidatus Merdivicinus sp.]|jgi:hypothetical protein